MSDSLSILPQGLPEKDFKEFYKLIFFQIKKDFSCIPFDQIAPDEDHYGYAQALEQYVLRRVHHLLHYHPELLGRILYSVDLPELSTRRKMAEETGESQEVKLAQIILKREAQKVWLRKTLS